jgi:hypothetical protein
LSAVETAQRRFAKLRRACRMGKKGSAAPHQ